MCWLLFLVTLKNFRLCACVTHGVGCQWPGNDGKRLTLDVRACVVTSKLAWSAGSASFPLSLRSPKRPRRLRNLTTSKTLSGTIFARVAILTSMRLFFRQFHKWGSRRIGHGWQPVSSPVATCDVPPFLDPRASDGSLPDLVQWYWPLPRPRHFYRPL